MHRYREENIFLESAERRAKFVLKEEDKLQLMRPRRKFQLRFSCWKSYFLLGQLGFGITGTR